MNFRPQTSPPPAPPPAPPASDVVTFLDRAGLGVYSPVFFSHGFTSIESLYSIRPEDYQVMQVKAGHQKKLKLALENLSATGQAGISGMLQASTGMNNNSQDQSPHAPPMSPYPAQMPPGSTGASEMGSLSAPEIASFGQQAYSQPSPVQPPFQKGSAWVDTSQESGYQWVDGPSSQTSATTPVDQGAIGAQIQQQQQQAQLQAQQQPQQQLQAQQQPGGVPMYQYSQAGTQWVDAPSAAPAQPVQQDMVFQWVDSPSYGRSQVHQQHYMQPPVSPYYQGVDAPGYGMPPRPLESPLAPHPGLDLRGPMGAPQVPQDAAAFSYPGAGLSFDQVQYSQRRDLQAVQYAQARQHPPLGVEDPTAAYQQAANAGSYQLFDHSAGRRGAQGTKPPGPAKGARGQQLASDGDGSKSRVRQTTAGSRQAADGGAGGGGGAGISGTAAGNGGVGGARRNEQANEPQVSTVIESMGQEGLRATLTTALESLYEDRIKPMANYVKGRLKERSVPELIIKSFVELYAQNPDIFLVQQPAQTQSGDEATIFFVTEPSWFKGWVDIDSPDDPYDECMWEELAKFLDGEHTFAGGRYGMARELMQRNLPFLAPHSLGEVCHIVQLAIQVRRLIVYHRKMLKPIQTVLCQLSPANGNVVGSEGEEIKDMDDLCLVLFRMLIHHPQGIRLCRMKQMIKHEFCRKLSEMAFQCTKLIELFNQEPLAATFVLDTENDGKSIYVRLGNPDTFTEHVQRIYTVATSTEARPVS